MPIDLTGYEVIEPAALKLPRAFQEALDALLEKIDTHHEDMRLSYVFLFGSAARGAAMFGSDLDVLLLTDAATEREVRIKAIAYDLDDDTAYIPIQITVRKTSRFIDPETDACDFNKTVFPDLKLLRRYTHG